MSNRLKIVSLGATLAAILGGVWYAQAHRQVDLPPPSAKAQIPPALAQERHKELPPVSTPQPVKPIVAESMATTFRNAKDYAEFTHKIRAEAEAGDGNAQYYMQKALHYCDDRLSSFFHVNSKRPRTLDEARADEVRMGSSKHPEMMQQEITAVYERCHTFLEDAEVRPELKQWTAWRDKAADNGVPAAESLKAQELWQQYLTAQYGQDSTHADPATPGKVHELILNALQSGDPQVFWNMADLMKDQSDLSTQASREKWVMIDNAWQLLACQRGFDCSAQAEWLRVACSTGLVCTPGETGQQLLEQMSSDHWDHVKAMANEIGAAVDAKDEAKLPTYLPGFLK
jgi:hypothetical protein